MYRIYIYLCIFILYLHSYLFSKHLFKHLYDTILDTKIRGSGYTQLTVTTVAVLQINLDILGTIRISTNNPRFILRISQNNLYLFSLPAEISVPLSRWKNAILKDCIFLRKFLPSS